MTKKQTVEEEKKVTNEKPVSLGKLNFREALAALLAIKQPPKEKKRRKTNKPSK